MGDHRPFELCYKLTFDVLLVGIELFPYIDVAVEAVELVHLLLLLLEEGCRALVLEDSAESCLCVKLAAVRSWDGDVDFSFFVNVYNSICCYSSIFYFQIYILSFKVFYFEIV